MLLILTLSLSIMSTSLFSKGTENLNGNINSKIDFLDSKQIKNNRKKVLVIYSDGGFCHRAATQSIKEMLDDSNYEVQTANFFEDIVKDIDTVRSLTFGYFSAEQAYNKMLRNGWNSMINYMSLSIAPILMEWKEEDLKNFSKNYFQKNNFDIVISTIPFINHSASLAAKELNIPYILLTLDLELKTWLFGLDKNNFYEKMYITLWNDNPETNTRLKEFKIPDSCLRLIGFPVRKQFFEDKNIKKLKEEYSIPQDKLVVMLSMGGSGGSAMYKYVKDIISLNLPVHVIACAGSHERLERKLKKLKTKENVSVTTLGFIQNMSDIMAVSDIIITKRGPGTLNESFTMGVPVLIDATGVPLFWESPHINLVKNYGFGDAFENSQQLKELIKHYCQKPRESLKALFRNKNEILPQLTKEKLICLLEEASSN